MSAPAGSGRPSPDGGLLCARRSRSSQCRDARAAGAIAGME